MFTSDNNFYFYFYFFSGDCVSHCSKEMMTCNETLFGNVSESSPLSSLSSSSIYGRKIDMLLVTEVQEMQRVELCSNEWKRKGVTESIVLKQQSKNLRVNAAILLQLYHSNDKIKQLMAMDCIGEQLVFMGHTVRFYSQKLK
jgi:hypothetical protein